MANVLYRNTYYGQCNFDTCQDTVCSGYNCTAAQQEPDIASYYPSIDAYYTCYPKCISILNVNSSSVMKDTDAPLIINQSYIIAIVAVACYAFQLFIALLFGVILAIVNREL